MTTENSTRDINSMRYDWRTRRMLEQSGQPADGMWEVSIVRSEPYESSHYDPVGLFKTLDDADAYCDAFDAALKESEHKEMNQSEYVSIRIKFIPFAGEIPAKFHNVYFVNTSRNEETGEREIESVSVSRYSDAQLEEAIQAGAKALEFLFANPDTAVFELEYEYVDGIGSVLVEGQEIVTSDVFPPLKQSSYVGINGVESSYTETSENFITLDPDNVVLKP